MKKKLLSLLLSMAAAFTLLCAALPLQAAAADANVLRLELSCDGEPLTDGAVVQMDDTVTMEVYLDASGITSGIMGVQADILYDADAFTLTGAEAVDDYTEAGSTVVFFYKRGAYKTGRTHIATYTFRADRPVTSAVFGFGNTLGIVDEKTEFSVTANDSRLSVAKKDVTVRHSGSLTAVYGESWDTVTARAAEICTAADGETAVPGSWSRVAGEDSSAGPAVRNTAAVFRFTPADPSLYNIPADTEIPLTVSPKTVETFSVTLQNTDKTYDGTAIMPAGLSMAAASENILAGDRVTIGTDGLTAAYAAPDAGEAVAITLSGLFTLSGADAENYAVAAQPAVTLTPAVGKIAKAGAEVTVSPAARSYNSNAPARSFALAPEEITVAGIGTVESSQPAYIVTYQDESGKTIPAEKVVGAADRDITYGYTVQDPGDTNFTFRKSGTLTVTRLPAASAQGQLKYGGSIVASATTVNEKFGETVEAARLSAAEIRVDAEGEVAVRYELADGSWSEVPPTALGSYKIGAWFTCTDGSRASGLLTDIPQGTYKVEPFSLSHGTVNITVAEGPYTYSGKGQEPAVSVEINGTVLRPGTDYTVSYSNNINVGQATVTVSGVGNYADSKDALFPIEQLSLEGAKVTLHETAFTYTGTAQEPIPTVTVGDITVAPANYTVSYTTDRGEELPAAPVNKGSYKLVVTAREGGNCTGTAEAGFTVAAKTVTAADFSLEEGLWFCTGNECRPAVNTATVGGDDFTVTYKNNIRGGSANDKSTAKRPTATVQLKANSNFASTAPIDLYFDIVEVKTIRESYPALYKGVRLSTINIGAVPGLTDYVVNWKNGGELLRPGINSYDATVRVGGVDYDAAIYVNVTEENVVLANMRADLVNILTRGGSLSDALKTRLYGVIPATVAASGTTAKGQNDYLTANLSDDTLLTLLDGLSTAVVTASSDSDAFGLSVGSGQRAAAGVISGNVQYVAKKVDVTAPTTGHVATLDIKMLVDGVETQPITPVKLTVTLNNCKLNPGDVFTITNKHVDPVPARSFTSTALATSVREGNNLKLTFITAAFSEFEITHQPAGTAENGGTAAQTPAAPAVPAEQPAAEAAPLENRHEQVWLNVYGSLITARSGSTVTADVTEGDFLPGYIIGAVTNTGVSVALTTRDGSFTLTPAMAKAMNSSYNYTFADAKALVPAPAPTPAPTAAPTPAPAPIKDPTAAALAPALAPQATPEPTAQSTIELAPTAEDEPAAQESSGLLPIAAAVAAIAGAACAGAVFLLRRRGQ